MRPGRFLSVAIVTTWVTLVGVHISRSYTSRASSVFVDLGADEAASLEDGSITQRGVFYRGSRIGHVRERITPTETGLRAEQQARFKLNVLGRERTVEMDGTADTGSLGQLERFEFRIATSSGRAIFETDVVGSIEDSELALVVRSGDSERTEHRKLEEPIVLPLNIYLALAQRGIAVGETYRLRLLDPMTLSEGEAIVEAKELEIVRWGGREEEAFRLQTTFAGLTTTTWVNDQGEVLQEETPLGWTLRKEAPSTSLAARTDGEADTMAAPDVLVQSAVPAVGFAGDADSLSEVVLKLENFPEHYADTLSGGRQTHSEDGLLRITKEQPPYLGTDSLSPEERAEALKSDAFIQSDDPAIVEKAAEIADGRTELDKVKALTSWVFENLTKSPTLSLPSAREVLEQRVGDCNEHAVLFTALARSLEIPTRIATGLAYTGGRFYYHAWPEVWVGRWLAVDPTFGQFPADPLHVRLLTGGLESQYEILALLGRDTAIEVVATE
jgi:hypothetical protein